MQPNTFKSALVNPPDPRTFGYQGENAPPPLGLGYIAASMRREGFHVDLFDFGEERDIDTERLESLGFFDYQLYGFTAYTKNFPAAIELLSVLRSRNTDAVVVFGGPHASPCAAELLKEYPGIDFVVRNEGERPMVHLARHLSRGEPELPAIPNLTFRRVRNVGRKHLTTLGADGDAVSTPASSDLPGLDDLPFPARDFRFEPSRTRFEYRRKASPVEVAYICSSRGCPKKCSFCSIVVMSPRYRLRSASSLMEEIQLLYSARPFGHISFLDANFFVHPGRTLDFARALYAWNPEITWSGTGTADAICRHAEVLAQIGALNCSFMEVGIESGNQETLARFNKWTTVEQNRKALGLLRDANIDVGLDFIMFDPETRVRDLRDNFSFLRESELLGYGPPECLYNAMRLYPGTPARERYIEMFHLNGHHLMPLVPPFVDAAVDQIFRVITTYLNRYQKRINRLIVELDAGYRSLAAPPRAQHRRRRAQEIAALVLRLNHEPYIFFDRLLTMAEASQLPRAVGLDDLASALEIRRTEELMELCQQALTRLNAETLEEWEPMVDTGTFSTDDIDLQTRFHALNELVTVDIQGTVYLIPPQAPPRRLNHTASDIWRLLVRGEPLVMTIQAYAASYGCSVAEAGDDVVPFLSDMVESGLLRPTGNADGTK
ncbi:MAG: radical SAM protein [Polyangiaceae bacterium]|nr:radical SAM protein [Polyangiaceae bacterium]